MSIQMACAVWGLMPRCDSPSQVDPGEIERLESFGIGEFEKVRIRCSPDFQKVWTVSASQDQPDWSAYPKKICLGQIQWLVEVLGWVGTTGLASRRGNAGWNETFAERVLGPLSWDCPFAWNFCPAWCWPVGFISDNSAFTPWRWGSRIQEGTGNGRIYAWFVGGWMSVTEPSELKPAAPGSVDDPMKVNMVGNTFMTHFIQFLMPVAKYKECPEAFYTLLQAIADDYKYIFEKGIKFGKHGKIWGCALACKGDAPYITKSGRFDRSFYHRPLQARSKKPGVGVCHMCMAGVESRHQRVEFEEFGTCPTWMHTEEESPAFTDPSPFLSIPRETDNPNGERFWKFDVFHNFHLGAGKYFLSSAIVHIVQTVVLGSNIDIRFENLTKEFIAFCRKEKLNAYYKRLTKEMFGIAQNHQAWPKGNWPKGDQTTVLALFLEDYCNRNIVGKVQDPICLKIVAGRFSLHIFGFFWLD